MSAVPPRREHRTGGTGTGGTDADATDADVIVVGYGPIGQVLSILLARKGWRVTVVERWGSPYLMPRATSFDGETARTLASLGIGSSFARIGEAADAYDWRNSEGTTLLRMEFSEAGRYGWPDATTMHQPVLESVLSDRASAFDEVRLLRGHTAVSVQDDVDRVEVTAETPNGDRKSLTASWLVGCDGANSFVRDRMGVAVTDLGFSYDWLLCDVVLHEPRRFVPANMQICDPDRPTTVVASGPGHRRWEFMRLPGEDTDDLGLPETAWRLLKPFDVTPENATLARHTVYTFRAAWADVWRKGRLLLAGDAAHSMPPFTGQGMCSGIRDVLNLSWKLDLVLRGVCDESLADTYGPERKGHVRETVETAVKLGKIVCVSDKASADSRDAVLLAGISAGRKPDRPTAQPLRNGLLYKSIGTVPAPPAGWVVPQGRVARDTNAGLFDEVVGTGFVLMSTADTDSVLGPEHRRFLDAIGTHRVLIAPGSSQTQTQTQTQTQAAADAVVDLDDVYLPFLASAKARFLLVRPDYHVFGAARSTRELAAVIDQLRTRLRTTEAGHPPRH